MGKVYNHDMKSCDRPEEVGEKAGVFARKKITCLQRLSGGYRLKLPSMFVQTTTLQRSTCVHAYSRAATERYRNVRRATLKRSLFELKFTVWGNCSVWKVLPA